MKQHTDAEIDNMTARTRRRRSRTVWRRPAPDDKDKDAEDDGDADKDKDAEDDGDADKDGKGDEDDGDDKSDDEGDDADDGKKAKSKDAKASAAPPTLAPSPPAVFAAIAVPCRMAAAPSPAITAAPPPRRRRTDARSGVHDVIGAAPTWPAAAQAASADFWGRFALRDVPALRSLGRMTAPAARRSRGPARDRPRRVEASGPAPIRGVVTLFDVWHEPMLASDPANANHTQVHFRANANHTQVRFRAGCFDRSLAKIRAGDAPFLLLVGHNNWRLASYEDGCVLLTQAEGRLNITILPFGSAGRRACREIQDHAAVGFRACRSRRRSRGPSATTTGLA